MRFLYKSNMTSVLRKSYSTLNQGHESRYDVAISQNPLVSMRRELNNVKTSEETKYAPSVVAETLKSLAEQAKVCHEKIDQVEAAQSLNRGEIIAEVGKLLDLCQNLRDAILSEDNSAA